MHRSFSAYGGAILVAATALVIGFATTSCGDSTKKTGCKSDKECTNKQVCLKDQCVQCIDNSQCPDGHRCTAEHACVAAPECERDDQCTNNRVCQAGKCKACAADGECASGTCIAGQCAPAKKCAKNEDCADDEDCLNGLCRKASAGNGAGATCALATVYFGFDDSNVQASERDRLAANAACIEKNKDKGVLLFGHTDTSGTDEYNIALSERRAQSAADYMSRLGTDPAKLQVVPKGETEPTGLGDDKDRRVEFQWK